MRSTWLPYLAVCIALAASTRAVSQQTRTLVVRDRVTVGNERAEDMVLPIATDPSGNLYFRYSDGKHRADAINKISSSGKKLFSLSPSSVPDLSEATIVDFSVSGEKLFVLARRGTGLPESIVATFTLNGHFLASARVDAGIDAFQLAPISGSSSMFLAGRVSQVSAEWTPAVIIWDSAKQSSVKVALREDIVPFGPDKEMNTDSAVLRDKDFEQSLVGSVLCLGDDGYVYLMRYGRSGLVFVLLPDGTLLRRLVLHTPKDTWLRQIKVVNDKIAAVFERVNERSEIVHTLVRLYDARSGEMLGEYLLDPSVPVLMAGYDGASNFTFVGPERVDPNIVGAEEAGRLRIFKVGPR
jgi:hypothetical protein